MKSYLIKSTFLFATLVLTACSDADIFRSTFFAEKYAEIEITPNVMKFGRRSVHSNTHRKFTLTNKGKLAARLTGMDLVPAPFQFKRDLPFPGLDGDCPSDTLQPGQSCTFVLTFRPLQVGEFKVGWKLNWVETESLKDSKISSIELSGEGVNNAQLDYSLDGVDALEDVFDFGTIALNSEVSRRFTVLYSGGIPATSVAFSTAVGQALEGSSQFKMTSIDCPANNISASCSVLITYKPTSADAEASTQINYDNGDSAASTKLRIKGKGSASIVPALLSFTVDGCGAVAPGGQCSFGNLITGKTVGKTITVKRTGTLPATELALDAFTDPSFRRIGGTCGESMPELACTIQVEFNTSVAGLHSSPFRLSYINGQSRVASEITLKADVKAAAELGVVTTQKNFGEVALRDKKTMNFAIRHGVNGGLNATNVMVGVLNQAGTNVYSVSANSCNGVTLAPLQECSINIDFVPVDPMTYTGKIVIAYDDGNTVRVLEVPILGTGITRALLKLNPTAVAFGARAVGRVVSREIKVDYFGSDPAVLGATNILAAGFKYAGNGVFPGVGGNCPTTIRGNCSIFVEFQAAAETTYSSNSAFNYTSNGQALQTTALSLTGSGAAPAKLVFVPTIVSFGDLSVGRSVSNTVQLKNTGGVNAEGLSFTGPSAPFSSDTRYCSGVLAAGFSCAITVNVQQSTVSAASATLRVEYEDGRALATPQVATLPLGANFMANPTLLLNDSLNFLDVFVGQSKTLATQLSYYGINSATAVSYSVRYATGGFTVVSGPGSTVSGSQTLQIQFSPTLRQAYDNYLDISYNDGTATRKTASIRLLGRGKVPAALRVSAPALPHNFGVLSWKQSASMNITLQNDGDENASSLSLSGLAAPFSLTGSLPTTVFPGSSVIVAVQFAPTSGTGAVSDTLEIRYQNGLATAAQLLTAGVTGTVTDRALLAVTSVSHPPNAVAGGVASIGYVHLRHVAGRPAQVVGVGGANSEFRMAAGSVGTSPLYGYPGSSTCGMTISADCYVAVYFAPGAGISGARTTTVSLNYNDGYNVATITTALTSNALTPGALAFNPASILVTEFLAINSVKSLSATVVKSGQAPVTGVTPTIAAPYRFAGGSYPGMGGTCGTTINANCTLALQVAPTAAGTFDSEMALSFHNGVEVKRVALPLYSEARAIANLTIAMPSGGMGDVAVNENGAQSAESVKDILFTNSGNAPVNNFAVTVPGPYLLGSAHPTNACTGMIAVGASCSVRVTFKPTKPGQQTWVIRADYHNGINATNTSSSLTGAGVVPVQIAVNGEHTCARTKHGKVKCWGSNNLGQLGLGTNVRSTTTPGDDAKLGSNAAPLDYYARSVAVGVAHSCAILDGGSVKCWGENTYGELGRGDEEASIGLVPSQMASGLKTVNLGAAAQSLSLGYSLSCAILDASTNNIKCWGKNQRGQLGLGDTANRGRTAADMSALAYVNLGAKAKSVSTKAAHVCAVLENNSVRCWGSNLYGQLGLGDGLDRGDAAGEMGAALAAVNLGAGRTARSVVAAGGFTCALLDNSQVKCWGKNSDAEQRGNLGTEWCENSNNEVGACGTGSYSEWFIGYGAEANQMGDNLPIVDIGAGRTVRALDAGTSHACVILDNGAVKCWGDNAFGQLGQGDTLDRGAQASSMGDALPALDLALPAVDEIILGHNHSCAINRASSQVKCWGYNQFGGLGIGGSHWGDNSDEMGSHLPALSL